MSVLLLHVHNGPVSAAMAELARRGHIEIVRDTLLSDAMIATSTGIITTMHLDQLGFVSHKKALSSFFANGGRLFFNGHILKPFVDGLEVYRPKTSPKFADFQLVQLRKHPVFGDLDPADMAVRKGVAGFYGRGHNPMPDGARALTGLGPQKLPIDWEWALPGGGMMFSHAGNDLWSFAPDGPEVAEAFAMRIVAWTAGALVGEAA